MQSSATRCIEMIRFESVSSHNSRSLKDFPSNVENKWIPNDCKGEAGGSSSRFPDVECGDPAGLSLSPASAPWGVKITDATMPARGPLTNTNIPLVMRKRGSWSKRTDGGGWYDWPMLQSSADGSDCSAKMHALQKSSHLRQVGTGLRLRSVG